MDNETSTGRRVVLAGLGVVFFGVDQVQSLLTRATERGQVMEEDAQNLLADASERSTKVVSSALASVLNRLPGVRVAYLPPSEQPGKRADAPAAPAESPNGQR